MSPIQIALLLLAVAGVWAIVELALTLRKTRTVVDSLDKTVTDLNNTIAEAQHLSETLLEENALPGQDRILRVLSVLRAKADFFAKNARLYTVI